VNKLSGSQVDKLGRRLRNAETPSIEDLQLLEQVRRADEDARLEVVQTLLAEGLQGTSRLKTTSTIVEKLRRESTMHLSLMQDIAGVRLVIDGGRLDQDRVVERIHRLFPDARTIDRRVRPSYGYRAVHIIVRTQGCLVEVQVRTHLQDTWAQMMERLADIFGRQIRYGEPPTDADRKVARGMTRQDWVDLHMALSDILDGVELEAVVVDESDELNLQPVTDIEASLAAHENLSARWDQVVSRIQKAREQFIAALHPEADDGGAEDQP
jgi:ppGpp synthetase/RelA/SpoT-type nucleotidyltranferase